MGRKPGIQYRGGSFWRTDDFSGFSRRAEDTRELWTGLIVGKDLWEVRQPQDFVRGVKDYQGVPKPRPVPPAIFDGPIATTLTANANIGATVLTVESTYGFSDDDPVGVMLNSGEVFRTSLISKTGSTLTIALALPTPAASGNQVIDEVQHIPPLPYGNQSA